MPGYWSQSSCLIVERRFFTVARTPDRPVARLSARKAAETRRVSSMSAGRYASCRGLVRAHPHRARSGGAEIKGLFYPKPELR